MKTVECKTCGKQVTKTNSRYNESIKNGWNFFCSISCRYRYQEKGKKFPCAQCGTPIRKTPAQIRQTINNVFCSKTCAALYNNSHKGYGTRRSKLELFIEDRLRAEFPNLNIRCNTTDHIGTELDFYFPELRMAIELNGILHYEPIYGQEKLERIQKNDLRKANGCLKEGVRLFVIDASDKAYLTQKRKERYWQMIKELVGVRGFEPPTP
jgi:YHS domain-containing protein